MTPAVSVRDAFRIYGDGPRAAVALQGLTLDVAEGEIVVVLGPSGSGKTTLLRLVAGLEQLSAGSVHAFGIDVGRLTRRQLGAYRAEQLGFLDQHYTRALSPELRVRDAVSLQLELRGMPTSEAERSARGPPRARRPRGSRRRPAADALGRRAAACGRLRRDRSPPAAAARRRAGRRARRRNRPDRLRLAGGGRTRRRRRCARRQPRCGGGLDRRPARPRARRPRRRGGRARRGAGASRLGGRLDPAAGRLLGRGSSRSSATGGSNGGDCTPTAAPEAREPAPLEPAAAGDVARRAPRRHEGVQRTGGALGARPLDLGAAG